MVLKISSLSNRFLKPALISKEPPIARSVTKFPISLSICRSTSLKGMWIIKASKVKQTNRI